MDKKKKVMKAKNSLLEARRRDTKEKKEGTFSKPLKVRVFVEEKKEVVNNESSDPQEHLNKLLGEKLPEPNFEYLEELEEKYATEKKQLIKNHLAEGMRLINEGLAYLLTTDRILESKGSSNCQGEY